jgi:hypothetical protein
MVVGGIQQSTKKGTMETAMPLLPLLLLPSVDGTLPSHESFEWVRSGTSS